MLGLFDSDNDGLVIMQKSRHIELETLEKNLDGNYRDPAFSLAFISVTYEGFGVGFSNIAAAAAYGLRIPLVPVYLVGIFVGVSYLLIEIRSTVNDVELQRRRLLELERKMITDNYFTYLSFTLPGFEEDNKVIDITTLLQTHKVEEISQCLGHYYQRAQEKAKQTSELHPRKCSELLESLDLKYTSEVSQFKNPGLVQILNEACKKEFFTPVHDIQPTRWQSFLSNLRKYYKSALSGAATAGGVTIFILTTALTTATVTALFPWSLIGISFITVIGAIVGYKIDKYFDRKRKHKNNLRTAASSHLTLKNQHRVAEIFRSTIMTLNELEELSNESTSEAKSEVDQQPPAQLEKPTLSEKDYCEVAQLKQQSHKIRRASDFIFPTLLLARGGFAAISSLFAGIGFAGLVLPLYPVFVIGGCFLFFHIAFKIWNNWVKHQSETQTINDLNLSISAEKVHYWQTKFPTIKDLESELKEKTTSQILDDLNSDYEDFKQLLRSFEESNARNQHTSNELKKIHMELLSLFSAQADSLNSKELTLSLAHTALYSPVITSSSGKIITFNNKVYNFISPVINFIAINFKDVVQGIAFGFGLSLTIFLILGITSIVATEAALIVGITSLAGVAMKVAIRHLIKGYRNEHLATIESAGKSIADKESLWDCRVETKNAHERAKSIIEQNKHTPLPESNGFIKDPSWTPANDLSKSRRPLQWIKAEAIEVQRDDTFVPAPRDFVC
ncbi:MAG: hypothetical protein K2X50_08155 [Gammaproteobacteria bacterium]|nr:hypothetical protein [Gammaproteobacteria bacterium]